MVMRRSARNSREVPLPVSRDRKAAGYGECSMNERMVQSHDDRQAQLPQAPEQPPRKRAWRFRKGWLALPLAVVGLWLYFAIDPGWWWQRQMARWHVVHRNRFTAAVLLGVVLLTALLMVRVICWVRNEKE